MIKLGDSKAKYAVYVTAEVVATKVAGIVYCNSVDEFESIVDQNRDELDEEGYFNTNSSNNFDLCDTPSTEKDVDRTIKFGLGEYHENNN